MSKNRLGSETSPYLLQHKDNPVHWWAWGPEALAEAKRTGKPILLSVGYAACHWCHVMAHESFEDEATAEVMNRLFVNIKVDREERPDVDAIYMGALHRLGEQGGWPLTMFLDSDGRPFWGGTYFPKQPIYGRPAFVTVLMRIAEAFQNQPDNVASNATALLASLRDDAAASPGHWINDTQIAELVAGIARAVDVHHGGLNGAPKFPQWNVFWLLWRGAIRFDDRAAYDGVVTTLRNICQGGIYDHLGGGFARYAVDERWLVPHFEKMLYDNALLLDLLTEVWRETREPLFAKRVAQTVGWLEREMLAEGGGFAASLDADSEGEEGKFYVWSADEVVEVLGAEDAAVFAAAYDVSAAGNFEGHNILNRLMTMDALSDDEEARLAEMRCKLFARRAERVRPGFDDKVLADWNGLMIAALARAATVFDKPDWRALAQTAYAHVRNAMAAGPDRLFHSYRNGEAKVMATASDYANMTWAALRLFEATGDVAYIDDGKRWSATLDAHHWDDEAGGYFTASDDAADLIVRLKSAADDAVPSANTVHMWNLLALHAITGDDHYRQRAAQIQAGFSAKVASSPVGHCGLIAQSLDVDRLMQIVVTEARDHETQPRSDLAGALHSLSVPGSLERIAAAVSGRQRDDDVSTNLRPGAAGKASVCHGTVCEQPTESLEQFRELVQRTRGTGLFPVG